jgi:exopolyphosphatase/guanosine-5'-triphosphate,3'-diphosphate pyrophosphatase
VREGVLFDRLNAATRDSDPLLVGARALNDLHARDPRHADELIEWVERFAASLPEPGVIGSERIRKAACLVSEIAWRANPDYRAEEASRVVAYAALFALEHKERAFLASTMHARYEGLTENVAPPLRALLSLREIERARALGCLLRVAYNISAGRHGVLPETPIRMKEGRIVQILPAVYGDLSNERLVTRLKQTAKVLGYGHKVQIRV